MNYVEKFIVDYPTYEFIKLPPDEQINLLQQTFKTKKRNTLIQSKNRVLKRLVSGDRSQSNDKKTRLDTTIPSEKVATNRINSNIQLPQIDINTDPIQLAKIGLISQIAQGNTKAMEFILQNQSLFYQKAPDYHYIRPIQAIDKEGNEQIYLNERQQEIIDCILDETTKVILIEGDRRTGKTTSWFYGMLENMIEGKRKKWGFWAATEQSCMKLHRDAVNDPKFFKYHGHLIQKFSGKKSSYLDGSCYIETHATKMSDASGLQYQGIIIDEFQQVITDNPDAFAIITGITRSEPNMKFLLVCNQGGSAYYLAKKKLKLLFDKGIAKYFKLEMCDTVHITEEQDEITRALMGMAASSSMVKAQLDNVYDASGDVFYSASIEWAYHNYKSIMQLDKQMATMKIMCVDPSGAGHPFGWFIGACNSGGRFFWELESGEMQLASSLDDLESREKWSQERIDAFLIAKAKEYNVNLVIIESNMSGPAMLLKFLQNSLTCLHQNFGPKASESSRDNMIGIARHIMDSHCLILKGESLQDSLLRYDPDKETKYKRKGDSADAMIHCLFKLCEMTVSQFMYGETTNIQLVR